VVEVTAHRVEVRRSGKWWGFRVIDVPGAVGQVRRLGQIDIEARDVLAMMLDVPQDAVELEVVVRLDDVASDAVEAAKKARAEAEAAAAAALRASVATVRALRAEDLSLRDIAELLGVSYQRISQLEQQSDRTPAEYRNGELLTVRPSLTVEGSSQAVRSRGVVIPIGTALRPNAAREIEARLQSERTAVRQ
jgi:transcriptional regulator with XRE-family HTH domain